jgi:alpha-N-acetylglucosamine transferase
VLDDISDTVVAVHAKNGKFPLSSYSKNKLMMKNKKKLIICSHKKRFIGDCALYVLILTKKSV